MKARLVSVIFALLLAALPICASASVWYVSTSGYDDPDNGHSWGEAFATIQYALSRAQSGDEVWVAEGYYDGYDGNLGGISTDGVSIYGGFDGETSKESRAAGSSSYIDGTYCSSYVIYASGSLTIDRLTVRSGGGTGIYCSGGSITVSNNTIDLCGYDNADCGGIYAAGGNVTITGNAITECTGSYQGGGICATCSSVTITDNTIAYNTAETSGGAIYIGSYVSASILRNSITGNQSEQGGAIYSDSSVQMSRNTITENSTPDNYSGGSVQLMAGGTVRDNVICANTGNGLFANGSAITVENNTIKSNSTVGMKLSACISGIKNNIFASNDYGIYIDGGTVQAATYNNSYGNARPNIGITLNSTNLTGNPLLRSDYHLQPGSCCIDAGTTTGSTTDIDGDQRAYNGTVDIGADEYCGAWDAASEFTSTTSTNGRWSYGWAPSLSSYVFSPYTTCSTVNSHLKHWYSSSYRPDVVYNDSGSVVSDLQSPATLWPANTLGLEPGDGTHKCSIVRWTAPYTASFVVSAKFFGLTEAASQRDVRVMKNGVALFSGTIAAAGVLPFVQSVSLCTGDTVDFVVATGTDNAYTTDATGLDARVFPVTAPTSWTIDRGIPTTNINGSSSTRSNGRWANSSESGAFYGGTFSISGSGNYRIDTVRVWAVPEVPIFPQYALGDYYDRLTLYTGSSSTLICQVTGGLAPGSNHLTYTDSADIATARNVCITPVSYGGAGYETADGRFNQVWQIDFNTPGWTVTAGSTCYFGVSGEPRVDRLWFSHSSITSTDPGDRLWAIDPGTHAATEVTGSPWFGVWTGGVFSTRYSFVNVQILAHHVN